MPRRIIMRTGSRAARLPRIGFLRLSRLFMLSRL
jgi:hypothetical protein